MPAVKRGPPPPDTYNYMLARFDWGPRQAYVEAIYGETRRSRSIEWPADWGDIPEPPNCLQVKRDGRQVCAIFVTSRHFVSRLRKLGWRDFTDEWKLHLNPEGTGSGVASGSLDSPVFSTDRAARGRLRSPVAA